MFLGQHTTRPTGLDWGCSKLPVGVRHAQAMPKLRVTIDSYSGNFGSTFCSLGAFQEIPGNDKAVGCHEGGAFARLGVGMDDDVFSSQLETDTTKAVN